MRLLSEAIEFPPLGVANSDGLLAFGGDLSCERYYLLTKTGFFLGMKLDSLLCGGLPILDLSYTHIG